MKAYKGLKRNTDGTLQCRDFKYEINKKYTFDEEISLCGKGFHACHELHQVWQFYPNDGNTAFYEVECGGHIEESDDTDGKFVCSEITLLKEVDMSNVAKFSICWYFCEGFAGVKLNGKLNFINTKGEILSPDQWFDDCYYFSEGFVGVKLNGKYSYINTKGELLSPGQWFDNCWDFNEGFGKVKLNDKNNYINTKGEILSEQWFDNCCVFNEGFAAVVSNGQWNYINTKGEILSPNQWFDGCYRFNEGFGRVKLNGKEYKIDRNGILFEK